MHIIISTSLDFEIIVHDIGLHDIDIHVRYDSNLLLNAEFPASSVYVEFITVLFIILIIRLNFWTR